MSTQCSFLRPVRNSIYFLTLLFLVATGTAAPNWWNKPNSPNMAGLNTVLTGGAAAWEFLPNPALRKAEIRVEKIDHRPVLQLKKGQRLTLKGRTTFSPDTDYSLLVRFPVRARTSGRCLVTIGNQERDPKTRDRYSLYLYAANDDILQCQAQCVLATTEKKKQKPLRVSRVYYLRGKDTMCLGWPENFRRQVEQYFAPLPSLQQRWIRVHIRAGKKELRFFVNNRLLAIFPVKNTQDITGQLQVSLTDNVMLTAVRARSFTPPPPFDPFELVPLRSQINAAKLSSAPIQKNKLPPSDTTVKIDGVPFVFPTADAQGDDHVDVGKSWFEIGNLEGYIQSRSGPFGGRWADIFTCNPGRIQFNVPKAQYVRLHLIAAASGKKNTIPRLTVQFFRPTAGFPVNIPVSVPLFAGNAPAHSPTVTALPVRLQNGRRGNLYHLTIDLNPGDLAELAQMDRDGHLLGLELTRDVQLYRSYPDPISYSFHGGGLPSGVQVYALTLERPDCRLELTPNQVGHVWTAPALPSYTAVVHNDSQKARVIQLKAETRSFDGQETYAVNRLVRLAAGRSRAVKIPLKLKRYGYHTLRVTLMEGKKNVWIARRSLAFLHPDTRERGNWQDGRGPIFGYWHYNGGHLTADVETNMKVMAQAGMETQGGSFAEARYTPEQRKLAEKLHLCTFKAFSAWDHYITNRYARNLATLKPEEADKKFLAELRQHETKPGPITRAETISFFPEPHLGPITAGQWPSYYGAPEYKLTSAEEKKLDYYARAVERGAPLVKKYWPNVKILVPHGNALFCIPMLRYRPKAAKWIDGVAVDSPNFERLPEAQTGQETISRLYQFRKEWEKFGRKPYLIFLEGNFVPTLAGAVSEPEQADLIVRNTLAYFVYGINHLNTVFPAYDAADYYGEEHYGAGYICGRYPLSCPKPAYAAVATLTRHINRANFVRAVPTGSLTVYCLEFQQYATKKKIYVLWTIRGRRPLVARIALNDKAAVYDAMDNVRNLKITDGKIKLILTSSPQYLEGLSQAPAITLGTPDHSDAKPGPYSRLLSNPANGHWQLINERDATYENNHPLQMVRFAVPMTATQITEAQKYGGRALAIHLGKQQKDRGIMPFYTSLVPRRPITIPGRGAALGLWVKAASDWGRVVYSLRDARGERWISIGTREQWNCDDVHGDSAFCFDGWRYLRFELPSNCPDDNFRRAGSTWWGHFGKGDGIIDLPLKLEKIIVERRAKIIYVRDLVPADPADVLLGNLYVEYEREADATRNSERLSRLRMPLPRHVASLPNPVSALIADGTLPAPKIERIADPLHQANGTQCRVYFTPVKDAAHYDIWVSPYPDGRGAMLLGKSWKGPGNMLRGLRPETDFYLFLTYTTTKKQTSKPSPPFPIHLKDLFFQK